MFQISALTWRYGGCWSESSISSLISFSNIFNVLPLPLTWDIIALSGIRRDLLTVSQIWHRFVSSFSYIFYFSCVSFMCVFHVCREGEKKLYHGQLRFQLLSRNTFPSPSSPFSYLPLQALFHVFFLFSHFLYVFLFRWKVHLLLISSCHDVRSP